MSTPQWVIDLAPRVALVVVCAAVVVLIWIHHHEERRAKSKDPRTEPKITLYGVPAALVVVGVLSAVGGVQGLESPIAYILGQRITPQPEDPPLPPTSPRTNCAQYTLIDPATGRLSAETLESCVSQINNCAVFTANLCHRYPGDVPIAEGYDTCISYIWKHMTIDDRAAFRTAIATQPLCKDIFHSILN